MHRDMQLENSSMGPSLLISEGMPVVCIANHEDGVYEKMISNIEEVRSRKGKIIAIITEGDQKLNPW